MKRKIGFHINTSTGFYAEDAVENGEFSCHQKITIRLRSFEDEMYSMFQDNSLS